MQSPKAYWMASHLYFFKTNSLSLVKGHFRIKMDIFLIPAFYFITKSLLPLTKFSIKYLFNFHLLLFPSSINMMSLSNICKTTIDLYSTTTAIVIQDNEHYTSNNDLFLYDFRKLLLMIMQKRLTLHGKPPIDTKYVALSHTPQIGFECGTFCCGDWGSRDIYNTLVG